MQPPTSRRFSCVLPPPSARKLLPAASEGALYLEALEERIHPAGGLTASIVDTPTEKYALINPYSAEPIKIIAKYDAATQQLFAFFRAADGHAVSTTIEGRVEVGDQAITGTFTFAELAGQPGVGVIASNAAVTFGGAVGIRLSDAGGRDGPGP